MYGTTIAAGVLAATALALATAAFAGEPRSGSGPGELICEGNKQVTFLTSVDDPTSKPNGRVPEEIAQALAESPLMPTSDGTTHVDMTPAGDHAPEDAGPNAQAAVFSDSAGRRTAVAVLDQDSVGNWRIDVVEACQ